MSHSWGPGKTFTQEWVGVSRMSQNKAEGQPSDRDWGSPGWDRRVQGKAWGSRDRVQTQLLHFPLSGLGQLIPPRTPGFRFLTFQVGMVRG